MYIVCEFFGVEKDMQKPVLKIAEIFYTLHGRKIKCNIVINSTTMKKLLLVIALIAVVSIIPAVTIVNKANEYAATKNELVDNNNMAVVDQVEGCYVFILSRPNAPYRYLGTVKKGATMSGSPESFFTSIVKKVKKEFPNSNGIIFTSIDLNKADCIEFTN